MDKQTLRAALLERRKTTPAAQAEAAGSRIAERIDGAADWESVRTVHVYRSLTHLGEVSTEPLIRRLAGQYPHLQVTVGDVSPRTPLPEMHFDVIFVPVVGFDRGGFRLGFGGGWYDRWLAAQSQALKIGLAYAWAEVLDLPHESHDIPLDLVVTDSSLIVA